MAEARGPIRVEQETNTTVIIFNEASIIGDTKIHEIEAQVLKAIADTAGQNVVLDFTRIKFMASSFIRLLVKVRQEVTGHKAKLTIRNVDPKIFELFKITQLHKVFLFE